MATIHPDHKEFMTRFRMPSELRNKSFEKDQFMRRRSQNEIGWVSALEYKNKEIAKMRKYYISSNSSKIATIALLRNKVEQLQDAIEQLKEQL